MKALIYKFIYDTGLAPNPFGKYCTLALCTPNHRRAAQLNVGDWIIGHKGINGQFALVYAMELTQPILTLDEYYKNSKFDYKKPDRYGSSKQMAGDNMYFIKNGVYTQDKKAFYHTDFDTQKSDIRGNRVFISENFYYLGENFNLGFPYKFEELVCKSRNIKYFCNTKILNRFIQWLKKNYKPKMNGMPLDFIESNKCKGKCK